ncbi:Ig-like domain-containing protein [Sulfurospirillum arcachonense]|uniref:Ig-like domain-containing protein n=1 Tax=Sulfurospirillum arcachonense TaxID=57666 RepID=UPI000469E3C7|nr:Ig-like domain-containing protein [Sulfurospirillum arcachonense]
MSNLVIKFILLCILSLSTYANVPIKNLVLKTTKTELKENTQTTLNLKAIYSNNTTKDITDNINWTIQDNSIVSIENNTLKALKKGTTTLQVKVNNITSNTITITVYKKINGYRLPPEPDPTINNSTLLGIDSNNNRVRDDVERWIYKTYDNPIEIGLFMQNARAYQLVIEYPSKAHETTKYIDNSYSCERYIFSINSKLEKKYEYIDTDKELKKIQFNTIQRHIAYQKYNAEFSGEVFSAPKPSKEKCEFDENGILGELK